MLIGNYMLILVQFEYAIDRNGYYYCIQDPKYNTDHSDFGHVDVSTVTPKTE